jgi:proteic killer suppression protein
VIRGFGDAETKSLFETGRSRKFRGIESVAKRKLDMIDAAGQLDDLRVPPGNRLEALKGDRKGQHSVRINDQFRICFRWKEDGAEDVEIVDYH